MNISKQIDSHDGSICELSYDESNQWLRATWVGHISPAEAHGGATSYLEALRTLHCPYLLNDNSGLRGPWFDSAEWLRNVWFPQAAHLGLRYIAHVPQPHNLFHEAAVLETQSFDGTIQVQLFDHLSVAEEWLREQQKKHG